MLDCYISYSSNRTLNGLFLGILYIKLVLIFMRGCRSNPHVHFDTQTFHHEDMDEPGGVQTVTIWGY